MFRTIKINNVKVRPIPHQIIDPNKIKGYDLIPKLYATIYMVAEKESGKATCIFEILKRCSNKDTMLVFFGSTIHNDPSYDHIMEYFEKRGNPILKYTNIIEDKLIN